MQKSGWFLKLNLSRSAVQLLSFHKGADAFLKDSAREWHTAMNPTNDFPAEKWHFFFLFKWKKESGDPVGVGWNCTPDTDAAKALQPVGHVGLTLWWSHAEVISADVVPTGSVYCVLATCHWICCHLFQLRAIEAVCMQFQELISFCYSLAFWICLCV